MENNEQPKQKRKVYSRPAPGKTKELSLAWIKWWCESQRNCRMIGLCVFCHRNFAIPPYKWEGIDTTEVEKAEEARRAHLDALKEERENGKH